MRAWARAAVATAVLAGVGYGGVRWQQARARAADPAHILAGGRQALRDRDVATAELAADRLDEAGHPEHAALLRGELAYRRGDYPRAERLLARVDGASRLFPDAAVLFGHCRFKQNDLRLAEQLFRRAAEERPDDPAPRRGLADVYFALGAMTLASAEFQAVARLDPADPRPWLALGDLYGDVGERVRAADAFTRAAALTAGPGSDPDQSVRARLGLAESLTFVGELDRAMQALDELPPAAREKPEAAVTRAEILLRRGATAAAGEAIAATLTAPDPPAAALLMGGKLAVAEGRFGPAAGLLERALRADPASVEASHQLASVYLLLDRPADADRRMQVTARIRADLERMSRLNDAVWAKPWDSANRDELVAVLTRLGRADIAARWAQAAAASRAGPPDTRPGRTP